MKNKLFGNPFSIGDTVYILAKYVPDPSAPLHLLECEISHIEHRQFVAYCTDGSAGIWRFSRADFNKCVFKDKGKAERTFAERINERING